MASRCRMTGNALEYAVCNGLQKRKIFPMRDGITTNKLKRLKRDFDNVDEPSRIKYRKLDRVLDDIGINSKAFPSYELTKESIGHSHAETADIVLHSTSPQQLIKLSIKHNNDYIKHQRPNKLHLQLGLPPRTACRFQRSYSDINDRYYSAWSKMGIKKWNMVPAEEKLALYREINNLTVQWVKRRLSNYLGFVLGPPDPHKYMLRWDPVKNDFIVTRPQSTEHGGNNVVKGATVTLRDNSFVEITLMDSSVVRMRIHNASSRITPTLSLKYTTSFAVNNNMPC